jgi:hypothetical protein
LEVFSYSKGILLLFAYPKITQKRGISCLGGLLTEVFDEWFLKIGLILNKKASHPGEA